MATGNEHQPLAVDAELDIDGQLDALLEQIDQAEPGLIARDAPRPPGTVMPVPEPTPDIELPVEAVVEPAAPAGLPANAVTEPALDSSLDASGMDLASQIQQLLDDARTHHTEPEPAPAAPAAAPSIPPAASIAPAAVTPPASPARQDMPSQTLNIQDIDQMLAEEADQALAGDFETIHEVLAAEQLPDAPGAPEPESVAITPEPAVPFSSSAAAYQSHASGQDDELEGSFEEPDAVLQQAALASLGRSELSDDARAVAQELDDQPENRLRAASGGQSAEAMSPSEDRDMPAASPALMQRVGQQLMAVPELVYRLCVLISRPVAALTPQSRDMVGYVGLITLFWGGVALVAKLLFVMRG